MPHFRHWKTVWCPLYFYVPIFSIAEKPNWKHKFSGTQSGHRSSADFSQHWPSWHSLHDSPSAPFTLCWQMKHTEIFQTSFSPIHKGCCTEVGIGWIKQCGITHILNCTWLKSNWIQPPHFHWNLHNDEGCWRLACYNLFTIEHISIFKCTFYFEQ